MTPTGERGNAEAELPEQMRAELAALFDDASAGGLSSAEFYDRLTDIHNRHLGADAGAVANEMSRDRALRAFEGLSREAPSRHHELELLAAALGLSTT
jgi:hypothetical protein